MAFSFPSSGGYANGEPTINRYAVTGAIPNYARTYQQTPKMRAPQYTRISISNPVINYGTQSMRHYTGYVKINSTQPVTSENTRTATREMRFNERDDTTEKLTEYLIEELGNKIRMSKNGAREVLTANQ